MVKIPKVFIILIFLSALVGLFFYVFPPHINWFQGQQQDLAEKLGVRIEDYPAPIYFPVGYYDIVIKPGMSLEDVHDLVRGYEKVYRCGVYAPEVSYYREIYYYFSEDDDTAIRFELLFDKQGNFERIQGEDWNSRTIQLFGCLEGVIPTKEK